MNLVDAIVLEGVTTIIVVVPVQEQVNETEARERFKCEMDFNENEDDSWVGANVAVVTEAMMTRGSRIMSITNESQLNLSKARAIIGKVQDEYNPTVKHVLDPNHPKA